MVFLLFPTNVDTNDTFIILEFQQSNVTNTSREGHVSVGSIKNSYCSGTLLVDSKDVAKRFQTFSLQPMSMQSLYIFSDIHLLLPQPSDIEVAVNEIYTG